MSGVIDHSNLSIKIDSQLNSALDLDTAIDPLVYSISNLLSNGTASGNASQQWHDTRTLTASATEDLDLAGGLTNAFGVALTFVRLKVLLVVAASGNTNSVIVSRKATTGIPIFDADGDSITLAAGDGFLYFSPLVGKAITPTTDDTLTFTNSAGGTSVTYSVILIGTD